MKTVLLKFSGPLQSWGTDSHFETRHTDTYPSKSGVIGMIASGLGYRRDEEEKLKRLNTLRFAVRIDQAGQILKDYHTVKKYKENGDFDRTYVIERYYLQDAVFIVALSSNDDELINDVIMAMKEPYFSLYLGRRSLPATADLLIGVFDSDAITTLRKYPWQASDWYQRKYNNRNRLQIFADEEMLGGERTQIRNDEVLSFSQHRGRKFSPRKEARLVVDVTAPIQPEEHDVFEAIERGKLICIYHE